MAAERRRVGDSIGDLSMHAICIISIGVSASPAVAASQPSVDDRYHEDGLHTSSPLNVTSLQNPCTRVKGRGEERSCA